MSSPSSFTQHQSSSSRPAMSMFSTSQEGSDSESSSTTSASSSTTPLTSTGELVRCMRCQRTLSDGPPAPLSRDLGQLDWTTNRDGHVRFGVNLYYCARCANMAGLKR
ncbi:MAG: hypothetical protein M1823_001446 [Watsoniomyces obsoletus]|nr:MAG: hypothetical protein M1823_001446 [Watsoniomyces obsoletus]